MKIADCQKTYRELTGQSSDIARKLNFSGIALIWVFRSSGDGLPALPRALFLPAFFIVLSLGLDLLQYALGALFWGAFARVQELRGVEREAEFKAPSFLNWCAVGAFWSKLISIAVAYSLLLKYAAARFVS